MDTFQATSWKFRQSEWEPYKYLYEPLKIEQGAIADPLYFDFATFVQAAAGRTRDSNRRACSRSRGSGGNAEDRAKR